LEFWVADFVVLTKVEATLFLGRANSQRREQCDEFEREQSNRESPQEACTNANQLGLNKFHVEDVALEE